jgi:outer membrane biosynthesis protein TonB
MKVAELKALIKDSLKETPKMSAGKMELYLYAEKKGLLKKPEPEPEVVPVPKQKKAEPPALKAPAKSVPKELPAELKKVVPKKVSVKEPEPVPVGRKGSAFAQFMKENKGQGLSMSALSAMYQKAKE